MVKKITLNNVNLLFEEVKKTHKIPCNILVTK